MSESWPFESVWAEECPACGRTVQGSGLVDVMDAHDCRVAPLIRRIEELERRIEARSPAPTSAPETD